MNFRKLVAIGTIFACALVAVGVGSILPAAAQSFPFPGGGTLNCGATSCVVVGGPFAGAIGTYNPATGAFSGNFGACTVNGSTSNPNAISLSPGCFSSAASAATLGRTAQGVSQVGITAVHSMITGVRDSLQSRRNSGPSALRYTWGDDSLDEAMNYTSEVSGKPVFKAMPKTPRMRTVTYALWGQGFGDIEWRSGTFNGIDLGRTTTTVGGIGGADVTITNIFSAADAYVIGVLGGETSARVRNSDGSSARVEGPGVGFYTIYVNGGFSTDSTFKVDFFSLSRAVPGLADQGPRLTNYTSSYNLNYKFDMQPWWLEPTVGASYTLTQWDAASQALGFVDGHTLRVQGGVRVGTTANWGGVTVEPTLAALAYSDVEIRGGTLVVATGVPAIPTDQGKVFGQGIGKLNFVWNNSLSSYVEGEVRGMSGVLGAAGRVGLRYAFGPQ